MPGPGNEMAVDMRPKIAGVKYDMCAPVLPSCYSWRRLPLYIPKSCPTNLLIHKHHRHRPSHKSPWFSQCRAYRDGRQSADISHYQQTDSTHARIIDHFYLVLKSHQLLMLGVAHGGDLEGTEVLGEITGHFTRRGRSPSVRSTTIRLQLGLVLVVELGLPERIETDRGNARRAFEIRKDLGGMLWYRADHCEMLVGSTLYYGAVVGVGNSVRLNDV
ncbi:hypothetical protein EDD85DRAFT_975081 [Armillaria nabsnona]|nr:hypothetical protein EDD85DRAFT_975081 [Armillaria nabsnona]